MQSCVPLNDKKPDHKILNNGNQKILVNGNAK